MSIRVSDPMVVDWLTKHYGGVIEEALVEVGRPGVRLTLHSRKTLELRDLPPVLPSKEREEPPDVDHGSEETRTCSA